MNLLDLFSGIGGFSLAAQRAGFKIEKHYASEVDKYAQQIYRYRFAESIQLGDVTRIGNGYGKIDIITGGFPCQSFSIAGKRQGFDDTRGTLFFEIQRLAREYKPRYMVLENVKGILNHDRGNTISVILDELRRLNFTVQLLVLNTVDFGIPQNRERCFFICTFRGERQPEISHIREAKRENTFCANCIDANYYKGIDNHGQRTCVSVGTLRTHKDGEGFREMQSGNCPTIPARAREDGSGQPVICKTIRSSGRGSYDGNHTWDIVADNDFIIRRLTPIECERLQDFPDDWTKYGRMETGDEVEISDTQRYKTLGNSITVKVAEEIFKVIKEAI